MGLFDYFKNKKIEKHFSKVLDNMSPPLSREQQKQVQRTSEAEKKYKPSKTIIETLDYISNYPNIKYNFKNIPVIHVSDLYDSSKILSSMYLLENSNREQAILDILSMNNEIKKARIKEPSFPDLYINKGSIRFTTENYYPDLNIDFTYLESVPLTKSGKKPKFPLVLHFQTQSAKINYEKQWDKNIFGHLYYLQNGAIGKYEIVVWYKGEIYQIKENFTLTDS